MNLKKTFKLTNSDRLIIVTKTTYVGDSLNVTDSMLGHSLHFPLCFHIFEILMSAQLHLGAVD